MWSSSWWYQVPLSKSCWLCSPQEDKIIPSATQLGRFSIRQLAEFWQRPLLVQSPAQELSWACAPLGPCLTTTPVAEDSLPLCSSVTGWHCLSSDFFHLGLYPASENILLTEVPLHINRGFMAASAGLLAVPALVSHSESSSASLRMAREASQQALSIFSSFPAKETLACQTARQHTTEILPHIASFFLFSHQELKRWVTDFQRRKGKLCWSLRLWPLCLLHLSGKGPCSEALKPTAYSQSP